MISKLKTFFKPVDKSVKYMLSLKKFALNEIEYDRELAILIYQGELSFTDTCHQDLIEEIYDFIEYENDLIFASMMVTPNDGSFILIHVDCCFTYDDIELLRQQFNCPVYYEMVVDNKSYAFSCS